MSRSVRPRVHQATQTVARPLHCCGAYSVGTSVIGSHRPTCLEVRP